MNTVYDYTLDRTMNFENVEYRIVDLLMSGLVLVVKEEDYKNNKFPLQTYIIPDE